MNSGETEPDMLATPISQLPPPILQDKKSTPSAASGGGAPSYDAIRDELYNTNKTRDTPPVQVQQQAPPQQQYYTTEYADYGPPLQYAPPTPRYPVYPQPVATPPPPVSPEPRRKSTPKASLSITSLLQSKRMWVLAAIIFGLVYWGIPRFKRSVPALVSPTDGRLTLPGLAGVSLLTAVAYTVASETVLTT